MAALTPHEGRNLKRIREIQVAGTINSEFIMKGKILAGRTNT
jgi:hypothetical protein